MRISHKWLQDYIDAPLPSAEKIAEALTMHAFEVESIETNRDDTLFEISILPNRSHDCLSYIGIAREVATLLDLPLKLPVYAHEGDASVRTSDAVTLMPPDGKLVRRALKRLAIDVKVGESPEWLKGRLIAQGQRPINNIVDATNFVMWETGQPVHAFDYDKLAGSGAKEISIRAANPGEKVTTLDGKEMMLDENMLVISDAEKSLDIAGVKGGNNSGIDASTKRVLLSACTFHPTSIRKTSRKLNLLTDASKRFEQEISPTLAERGMARLAALIADIAEAKVAADTVEFYPRRRNPYFVGVSVSEVNALLGTSLASGEIEEILTRLGFEWEKVSPVQKMLALAPTLTGKPYAYAASISYDAPNAFDCSSFLAYLHARAGVVIPRITLDQFAFGQAVEEKDLMPGDVVFAERHNTEEVHEFERISDGKKVVQHVHKTETREFAHKQAGGDLYHDGLYLGEGKVAHAAGKWHRGEVIIEDLAQSPAFEHIVGYRRMVTRDEERYVITPPPERLDLHAGPGFMISGNAADLIEEIGRVYGYANIAPEAPAEMPAPAVNKTFYYTHKIRDALVGVGFSEVMTYAFQGEGEVAVANPLAEDKKYLRASLAAGLSRSLELNIRNKALLGGDSMRIFEIGTVFEKGREYLQLGIVAEEQKDVEAAFEKVAAALGTALKQDKGLVDLTAAVDGLPEPGSLADLVSVTADIRFKPLSIYPIMLRDIAVWVPDTAGNGNAIIDEVKKEAGNLFVRADLFDTFSKDGKTSYAYHLVFQSQEKTLSDDEANAIMARVTDTLNGKEGFKVR